MGWVHGEGVLAVTDNAAQLIEELTTAAHLPAGAGLRIADAEDRPGLRMEIAEGPAAEDAVVALDEVRIFLDPPATHRLAEETLDARTDERGCAFFLDPN